MEIGKYISLGNGIQVRKSKNETYTYYHSFRDKTDNKVKRKKLFTTDKVDNKALKKAILLIDKEIEILDQEKKEVITLNDLADEYFKVQKLKLLGNLKRKYADELKELNFNEKEFMQIPKIKNKIQNANSYVYSYNRHFRTRIGKEDITKLRKKDFANFLDNYLNGLGLSKKTVFNLISLVKTIINFAIKDEIIDIVNPLMYFEIKNPKRKRERYLNFEELEILLKECRKHKNPNVYMFVYLSVLTASREQTVLNIRKRDIDFENNFIKLDNFKNDEYYKVPISEKAAVWLKKQTEELNNNDYLISNLRTKEPLLKAPDSIKELMDELFNNGINKQNNLERDFVVNIHTIRRSIATNMSMESFDIYKIMTFLDHHSTGQTEDYLSLKNIKMKDDIEVLSSKIFANF